MTQRTHIIRNKTPRPQPKGIRVNIRKVGTIRFKRTKNKCDGTTLPRTQGHESDGKAPEEGGLAAFVVLVVFTVLVMLVRVMGGMRGLITIMIGADDTDSISSFRDARRGTVGVLSLDFDESGRSTNERENAEHGVAMVFLGDIYVGRFDQREAKGRSERIGDLDSLVAHLAHDTWRAVVLSFDSRPFWASQEGGRGESGTIVRVNIWNSITEA